jgi:hypothetical protein
MLRRHVDVGEEVQVAGVDERVEDAPHQVRFEDTTHEDRGGGGGGGGGGDQHEDRLEDTAPHHDAAPGEDAHSAGVASREGGREGGHAHALDYASLSAYAGGLPLMGAEGVGVLEAAAFTSMQ